MTPPNPLENPGDQQKRLLLTIVVSTILMVVYMQFFAPKPPEGGEAAAADAGGQVQAQAPAADAGAAAELPMAAAEQADGGQPAVAPPAEQIAAATAELETPAQRLTFSNRGAALSSAVIKDGDKWKASKFVSREKSKAGEPVQEQLVHTHPNQPYPVSTQVSGDLKLGAEAMYSMEKGQDEVTFTASTPELTLTKRYRINPNGYELRVEHKLTNKSASAKKAKLAVVYPAQVDPATQGGGGMFNPPPELSQAICRHGTSNETMPLKKEQKTESFAGPVKFAGFDERYFAGLIFPRFAEGTSCSLSELPGGQLSAQIEADLGEVRPGETVTREFGIYLGPKAHEELQRVSKENEVGAGLLPLGQEPPASAQGGPAIDPELAHSIDFGWWAVICRILLDVMKLFQKAVVNWGVAIILLTILVKALLYPLSVKQMESMEAMKKLQPQLEVLKKKYEKDKDKFNQEQMRLFQENKVNPFGGCLPLLVQMPVWIALYRTLQSSFELYREPLLPFWIHDLTLHDPYYILPIVMGITMFITQKMQPQMGDPTQAKIMLYMMPVFFTFIMLNLPAGLTLYIFTNNLLSIAQQKYLQRRMRLKAAKA